MDRELDKYLTGEFLRETLIQQGATGVKEALSFLNKVTTGDVQELSGKEQAITGEDQGLSGKEQAITGEDRELSGKEQAETVRDEVTGQFVKGHSGNPSGRPKGINMATRAARATLEMEAVPIVLKGIKTALYEDAPGVLQFCLGRLIPMRKGTPVTFDLPPIASIDDLAGAQIAILKAVAEGSLTPQEGQSLSAISNQVLRTMKEQNAQTSSCEQKG